LVALIVSMLPESVNKSLMCQVHAYSGLSFMLRLWLT